MAVIHNNRILKYLLMMVVSLLLVLNFSIGVSASSGYDRQEADACTTISERLSVKGGSGTINDLPPNQGYSSFKDLKKSIGSAGNGNDWHHIVEQSQIKKSGFNPEQIHNTNNIIAVDHATHMKITGYYNTKSFRFTGGLSVRDWLAGQSYEIQYNFGLDVLRKFGVIE